MSESPNIPGASPEPLPSIPPAAPEGPNGGPNGGPNVAPVYVEFSPPTVEVTDSVDGVEQVWVHLRRGLVASKVVKPHPHEFIYVTLAEDGAPISVSFLRPKGFVPKIVPDVPRMPDVPAEPPKPVEGTPACP